MENIQALFESKPVTKKVGDTFTAEVVKSYSFTIPKATADAIVRELRIINNELTISLDWLTIPTDYKQFKPGVMDLARLARYLIDSLYGWMTVPGKADPLRLMDDIKTILARIEEIKKFKRLPPEHLDPVLKTVPKLKKWVKDCKMALSEEFTKSLFESQEEQELLEAEENEFLEAFGDKKGEAALKHLKSKKYKFGDFHVVNTRTWEDDEGKTVVSLLVQRNEEKPFDILIEE